MGSAMGVPFDSYTAFDWACFASGVVVPLPALYGAVRALWTRALAPAGRRPEPTVAALLGNACWFLWGWTEHQEEPLVLNAWGGGIQLVALLAFLLLCTPDERMRALRRPISGAAVYFAGTVGFAIYCIQLGFGVSRIHLGLYQCACTFAGWVAGAAPLLTLLAENADAVDEVMPPSYVLVLNTAHGLLWSARGVSMDNYFMLSQNMIGCACSAYLLLLAHWPQLPPLPEDYVIVQIGIYQFIVRQQLPLPQALPLPAAAVLQPGLLPVVEQQLPLPQPLPLPAAAVLQPELPPVVEEPVASPAASSAASDPQENLERVSSSSSERVEVPPQDVSSSSESVEAPHDNVRSSSSESMEMAPPPLATQDVPTGSGSSTPARLPRRSSRLLLQASQGTRNAPTSGGESSSKMPPSSSKKRR